MVKVLKTYICHFVPMIQAISCFPAVDKISWNSQTNNFL